jgi:hypothetical protein
MALRDETTTALDRAALSEDSIRNPDGGTGTSWALIRAGRHNCSITKGMIESASYFTAQ